MYVYIYICIHICMYIYVCMSPDIFLINHNVATIVGGEQPTLNGVRWLNTQQFLTWDRSNQHLFIGHMCSQPGGGGHCMPGWATEGLLLRTDSTIRGCGIQVLQNQDEMLLIPTVHQNGFAYQLEAKSYEVEDWSATYMTDGRTSQTGPFFSPGVGISGETRGTHSKGVGALSASNIDKKHILATADFLYK